MALKAVRLIVQGRVQGVGYRWWTRETARGLGLDGWVRNLTDGSVEILAIGGAQAVDQLVARCHEGPAAARVSAVTVEPAKDDGSRGFEQRATREDD